MATISTCSCVYIIAQMHSNHSLLQTDNNMMSLSRAQKRNINVDTSLAEKCI